MGELLLAYIEKRESKDGLISDRVQVRMKGYPTQTATFARITDAKNGLPRPRWRSAKAALFQNRRS
jgi:hypothetical protein